MSRAISYLTASCFLWCAPISAACAGPACQPSAEAAERDSGAESCAEDQETVAFFQLHQQQHPGRSRPQPAAAAAAAAAAEPADGRREGTVRRPPQPVPRAREQAQRREQLLEASRAGHEDAPRAPAFDAKVGLVAYSAHAGKRMNNQTDIIGCVFSLFAVLAMCTVGFLNRSRGLVVVAVILLFMSDFATVKLVFEWASMDFPFPAFISTVAFLFSACVTACIIFCRSWLYDVLFPVPSFHELSTLLLPSCLAFALSVIFVNEALIYCTPGFVEMLGATACFWSVLLSWLFGLPVHISLLLPLLLIACGSAIATLEELSLSVIGLLLISGANVCMAMQGVLQQRLMTTEGRQKKYDPCTVTFWSCIPGACLNLGISLTTEGSEPYRFLAGLDPSLLLPYSTEVLLYCTLFTCLQLTSAFVVREMGAVGFSVMVMASGVLTVLGSIFFFSEVVTALQFVGYGILLIGVFWFNRIMTALRGADQNKEKDAGLALKGSSD